MASFNQVTLVGNITREVELKHTQSGMAVANLGLAVNEKRKDASGQYVDETVFVDVTAWGRTAEVAAEYLRKGSPVLIGGRLKFDQWEKDGKKNSKLSVVCDKLQMIGGPTGKADSTNQAGPTEDEFPQDEPRKTAPAANRSARSAPPSDDIPF